MTSQESFAASGALLGAVTVLCWAGFNVAAKAGIDAGMSPAALSVLRYLTPGMFALPLWIWVRHREKNTGVPIARVLCLALLGGPVFGLVAVAGYRFAPLSHGLLFAPVTVFVTGTMWGNALLGERISAARILGALVMFAGLALLVGVETDGLGAGWPIGIACFVTAGVLWGSYTALLRYWKVPTLEGTAAVSSMGAVIAGLAVSPWAWESLREAHLSMLVTQVVMQGLVGGILSVIALIAALQRLSVQTAAMLPTFTPAVAMVIAWAAIGLRPAWMELVGAAIIFAGFALATRQNLFACLMAKRG